MGCFVMAETNWMEGSCSIVEGESTAILKALQVMEQRGYTHVIFEMDSKSVVDAVHHLCGGSSEFSSLISKINNIMSCNQNFMVKFRASPEPVQAGPYHWASKFWRSQYFFFKSKIQSIG
jgi:ribonuclease HI